MKHMIAVGAAMHQLSDLARTRSGGDQWAYSTISILRCAPGSDHALKARKIFEGKVDGEIIDPIMAHNHRRTGVQPDTMMKKALIACDAVSGLITACALVVPTKKLAMSGRNRW